jgi:glycosyltransferase involved in cell wall biosynthesis
MNHRTELTILMPCLNEAKTLAICIQKAQSFLTEANIEGEVLIADNGSTDGSQKIAQDNGARLVAIPERGYGAALIGGCNNAFGKYVIMGDADDSYDFTNLMPFVERLRAGDELVMGNRFKGGIKKGAMPPLHRYLGNPVLSGLGKFFFKSSIGDFHCGLRGYNTESIRKLGLKTTGMEYASEMVVQAVINDLKISEVPTTLSPDGRSRPPHLRSWRDGWRHLKFLLMHSPKWLFLYPGLFLIAAGIILGAMIMASPLHVMGIDLDINTLLYSAAMVLVGGNLFFFHVFTKVYAVHAKFIKSDKNIYAFLNANNCLRIGIPLILIGIGLSVAAVVLWGRTSFGALDPEKVMRITIPAVTLIIIGIQDIFSGFLVDILRIDGKASND